MLKDCKEHSDKNCCCGGHNSSNVKKNKHHNSTKTKLTIRKNRKFKRELENISGLCLHERSFYMFKK